MPDPRFLYLLTNDYVEMMQAGSRPAESSQIQEDQPQVAGDISGLKIIVDAEELFSQIQPQLESSEFFSLMVAGQQGSGKSTLTRELAHHAHLQGYKIVYISGIEIINSPEKLTQEAKGHKKVCCILDDASFAVTSAGTNKQQSKLKSFYGLIRHALEGAQVLMITDIHIFQGVPPIFRNSSVWVFSKPSQLEYDTMIKIIGRNKKSREMLDRMFQSIVQIQAAATKSKIIPLNLYGRNYTFRWGDKTEPGDGRLMLLLLNGQPLVYNATSAHCEECAHVAFTVKVRMEDYGNNKRPSEENDSNNGGQIQ